MFVNKIATVYFMLSSASHGSPLIASHGHNDCVMCAVRRCCVYLLTVLIIVVWFNCSILLRITF
jgi:hypothetical protein